MDELAIEVKDLVKSFGKERVLDRLHLSIPKGIVYGLLGPNGAGKTTTVRILSTLLKPDGGHVKILGYDTEKHASEVRKRISLTGQYASVDEDLTGLENLVMLARLLGYPKKQAKERARELLEAFRLEDAAKRLVKNYSGGMRRRIDIAASIIVAPEILFLDEPTTGLDPESRNEVWEVIRAFVKGGTTVILTTQYLEEADQLADRIAVINRGKLIAEGTSNELKDSVGLSRLHITIVSEKDLNEAKKILEQKLTIEVQIEGMTLSAQVNNPSLVASALGELANRQIEITDFSLGRPTLDEAFLNLTSDSIGGVEG
ncbi:ATP-binding cassette domain-containing protein [Geomicrobium sp. JCM 19038]|uniref:ATP-binding cassette domain-containing protein n=1 Tax=Geomicrobium sp. JCM 19038 TaxID=1460635 RepID=UPI00045F4ADB|nr:ATP-binding cassette domain-containing protein [Geomicrobium sp. JCM 19038]GAK09155.1 ABC-transporter ATP-binding component [Geomicrobium sp. JCM 19038]